MLTDMRSRNFGGVKVIWRNPDFTGFSLMMASLRSKGGYMPYPNYGNTFLQSFFPFFSRMWNTLSSCIQSKDLTNFKNQLILEMKPVKIKHFSIGSKVGNSLLASLRTGRFTIGQEDDPSCMCHAKEDCSLYTAECQTLLT